MTRASDLGFIVGNKYKMISTAGEGSGFFEGMVLTFHKDDGSECPYFKREDGIKCCPYLTNLSNKVVEEDNGKTKEGYAIKIKKCGSIVELKITGKLTKSQIADIILTVYN
jgi:hypothetical protein